MYLSLFSYTEKQEGSMKSSNIGGQAVLEGIMMKNKTRYAVAVRKPDQQIEVCVKEYKGIIPGRVYIKCRLSGEFLILSIRSCWE